MLEDYGQVDPFILKLTSMSLKQVHKINNTSMSLKLLTLRKKGDSTFLQI
jgi:hypothetical protein